MTDDDRTPSEVPAGVRPSPELLEAVYAQLRAIAQRAMAAEGSSHTLQATALVHEAFLRLSEGRQKPWANEAHFFAAAAEAMRRILLDHAKSKRRIKRGGGRSRLPLDVAGVADLASGDDPDRIEAFDRVFRRFEHESPDAAEVVRLRFYAGLSVEQTAASLGVSTRTVNRHWTYGRAWLARELQRDAGAPSLPEE